MLDFFRSSPHLEFYGIFEIFSRTSASGGSLEFPSFSPEEYQIYIQEWLRKISKNLKPSSQLLIIMRYILYFSMKSHEFRITFWISRNFSPKLQNSLLLKCVNAISTLSTKFLIYINTKLHIQTSVEMCELFAKFK